MRTTKVQRKPAKEQPPRERIINAARRLFNSKGFHAATTAELATEASVSIGQVYRHFESKDDIVIAIAEQIAFERSIQNNAIFDALERGEISTFEAIRAIAAMLINEPEEGLFFEILAESCRNPSVAERMKTPTGLYRNGIRRLAELARPDAPADEVEAYVDLMMACFVGLSYRPGIGSAAYLEKAGYNIARVMIRALGLTEESAGEPIGARRIQLGRSGGEEAIGSRSPTTEGAP